MLSQPLLKIIGATRVIRTISAFKNVGEIEHGYSLVTVDTFSAIASLTASIPLFSLTEITSGA